MLQAPPLQDLVGLVLLQAPVNVSVTFVHDEKPNGSGEATALSPAIPRIIFQYIEFAFMLSSYAWLRATCPCGGTIE
jgi:hypothetical protein